jgi:uncharacterized protein (DUF1015 family)
MAKTFSFKGVFYNKKKIKNLSKLMAPPYDVISPQEQEELYAAHDYNAVRLILGKDFAGDTEFNNKYVRAATYFEGLLRHAILLRDEKPAYYVYEQIFKIKNKKFKRLGFIGLLRLEELSKSKVYPHESTFAGPKSDRLQLMLQTNAQFESIFGMYLDKKDKLTKFLKKFAKNKPFLEAKDKQGTIHRIWKIDKKAACDKIAKEMKDKWVFIADGHHRYEATMRYRDAMKDKTQRFSEDESYNHIMMYFTNAYNKGLVVLPIHRLIKGIDNFDPLLFSFQIHEYFDIKPFEFTKRTKEKVTKKFFKELAKEGKSRPAIGMYLGEMKYYILTLKDPKIMDDLVDSNKPKIWRYLEPTVVQTIIIEKILKLKKDDHALSQRIKYSHNEEEVLAAVENRDYQVGLFLNPTKIDDIITIASKYEKMPQKSTFFYPKLLSGLIMNKIDLGEKLA